MSANLATLNVAAAALAQSLDRLNHACRRFATEAARLKEEVWKDPALLRAFNGGWPKKERRRIGRRIRRLESVGHRPVKSAERD